MKVNAEFKKAETPECEFPCHFESKVASGLVVLAFSRKVGVVASSGTSVHQKGHVSIHWNDFLDTESWKPIKGKSVFTFES